MDGLLYIVFSVIEGFSILYLILNLFRISTKEHIKAVLVANIFISISTYYFQESILSDFSPLLIMLLLLLFLVFIFKVSLLYSIFVTIFGFVFCLIIQGLLIYIPTLFTDLTFDSIKNNDFLRYSFQFLNSVLLIIVGRFLHIKGFGFTFALFTPSMRFKLSYKNLSIIMLFGLTIVVTGIIFDINNMFMGISLLLVIFICLLFIGIKGEVAGRFD
jgi:hypothetical protein